MPFFNFMVLYSDRLKLYHSFFKKKIMIKREKIRKPFRHILIEL